MSETLIDEKDKIEFAEKERDYELSKKFDRETLLEEIDEGILPPGWGEKITNWILWG